RVQPVAGAEALDGADLLVADGADAGVAGADALVVEQDGAGAAAAFAAAVLAAGQAQVVAQDAEQAAVGVGVDGVPGAVDVEFLDRWHNLSPGERGSSRRIIYAEIHHKDTKGTKEEDKEYSSSWPFSSCPSCLCGESSST